VFLALFLALLLWGTGPNLFLRIDPLAAALNALATRALYRGLLACLVILIPALFLGRFFCGWICPLGTLHHVFGNLRSERKRGRRLLESNRYKPWQKLKYYFLIAGLAAALFGSGILGLLDPISLAIRSFSLAVFPALNYAFEHSTGIGLSLKQPHFRQAVLMAAVFILLIALNLRVTRFWCRALCPLGALLGAAARWSALRLEKDGARCGDCNRCLLHCQGGDDPIPGARWRKAECHLCLNCVADCPQGGLAFRFRAVRRDAASADGPELGRRRVLTSLAAGIALTPLARAAAAPIERRDRLVRPPGALDEPAFLARCIRCGECMRVCPSNAVHPAFLEGGAEALWTPLVVPRIGYCQPSCVLCGHACPTGAIWEISAREKGWLGEAGASATHPVRIGTAFYDRGRCLPWAMATECIVCQEWCPTSPKAIYLREAEIDGQKLRQPYVHPELCVGCGACEFACPVADRPAVYVTSVGESRSRSNQFLLRKAAATAAMPALPDAEGWTKTGAIRRFDAPSLWRYLDGGADKYVNAGLAETVTAPYRFRSGVEAVADLHVFATSAGAARVLDSEPAAPPSSGSLAFRKGRYLVRLTAYSQGPEVAPALSRLARAIERELPQ
jgi:polyferredoxin